MLFSHQLNLNSSGASIQIQIQSTTNANANSPNHHLFNCPTISLSTSLLTKIPNNKVNIITVPRRIKLFHAITTAAAADDKLSHSSNPKTPKRQQQEDETNFWGAVTLIIGTAVGPGMLGLPSATIKAGPLPSTLSILLSWLYVISSILLVAELSFVSMQQHALSEVSFTTLATNAFGPRIGAFVALVYAFLSFALIVACVSGIGTIISQCFPFSNSIVSHALFPCLAWILIAFFPFKLIDLTNRLLCFLMLFSITALVSTGVSVGRANLLTSFAYASWAPSAILPSIPITVLTLGFHVITPFVCKIAGKNVFHARKAILLGGAIPLIMVLSWNLVVLGLAQVTTASHQNPISLLLSVSASALPAVQGFAFAALATSLIGYVVSFPKQLLDTLELIWRETGFNQLKSSSLISSGNHSSGSVGFAIFWTRNCSGIPGQISFSGSRCNSHKGTHTVQSGVSSTSINVSVMAVVLGAPVLIALFFPAAFSKALDFAGIYANCFLFGILPPAMAWIHRSKRKFRSEAAEDVNLLPGGNIALLLLFIIAFTLAIWH
ncbi:tyrosine-specific transport protein-like [Thalictrum thalictroides]|uniref:Tyrosine-specific transport protein-like n=1 Tax=Thalictrum thalictroides TaxID=46969 RepID=A0A7J6V4B0_THATH|nr:tyrosine-specific transport protein-like [Thalictrum thalictroides]